MTETESSRRHTPAQIAAALRRYQILAWTTGVWLLVLTAEVVYHFLILPRIGGERPAWAKYIGTVHGWLYFIYLIAALDLSLKARLSPKKVIVTLVAGTVPFLSFFVERRRTHEIRAALAGSEASDGMPS